MGWGTHPMQGGDPLAILLCTLRSRGGLFLRPVWRTALYAYQYNEILCRFNSKRKGGSKSRKLGSLGALTEEKFPATLINGKND